MKESTVYQLAKPAFLWCIGPPSWGGGGSAYSELDPPTLITNHENAPTGLPTGQSVFVELSSYRIVVILDQTPMPVHHDFISTTDTGSEFVSSHSYFGLLVRSLA